jgi:hypothetical protein
MFLRQTVRRRSRADGPGPLNSRTHGGLDELRGAAFGLAAGTRVASVAARWRSGRIAGWKPALHIGLRARAVAVHSRAELEFRRDRSPIAHRKAQPRVLTNTPTGWSRIANPKHRHCKSTSPALCVSLRPPRLCGSSSPPCIAHRRSQGPTPCFHKHAYGFESDHRSQISS